MIIVIYEPNPATRKLVVDYVREQEPVADIISVVNDVELKALLRKTTPDYLLSNESVTDSRFKIKKIPKPVTSKGMKGILG